jgi:hypothetical protein
VQALHILSEEDFANFLTKILKSLPPPLYFTGQCDIITYSAALGQHIENFVHYFL